MFECSVWLTKIVYFSSPNQTMRIHTEDTDGGAAASPGNDARCVWCNFPTGSCDHRETDSSSGLSGPVTMELIVQCLFTACKITLIQTENLISIAKIFANNSKVYFWATIHYSTLNMITITLAIRNYLQYPLLQIHNKHMRCT